MQKTKLFSALLLGLMSSLPLHAAPLKITPEEKSVIALNNTMFGIYDQELKQFEAKLLDKVPVIVARFSTEGGHLTLYRPHQAPLLAEFPSISYQLAKSVGHSVMITYDMMQPYVHTSTTDKSWRTNMSLFQTKVKTALQNMGKLQVPDENKEVYRQALTLIDGTLSTCLKENKITEEGIAKFATQARPFIPKLIEIGASAQVEAQMKVIGEWKKLLGKDWDNTYAITNTIYVTRQNNILFSMLAEWMGKDAINHRLFLFETTSFTTTDKDMLQLWSRIMFDRQLSQGVFGDDYLMDSELIANGGRDVIIKVAKQYQLPNILPDMEPFNSTGWPWRHDPSSGTGAATLSEVPDFQSIYKH